MTQREKEARKRYDQYVAECRSTHASEILSFNMWCFIYAKREDLKPFSDAKIAKNREMIKADNENVTVVHADGSISRQKLNPEFVERAAITKQLKNKLKLYTGDKEYASDLLFAHKKEMDAKGIDWITAAKSKKQELEGKQEEKEKIEPLGIEHRPKKSILVRFKDKLMKAFSGKEKIKKVKRVYEVEGKYTTHKIEMWDER